MDARRQMRTLFVLETAAQRFVTAA